MILAVDQISRTLELTQLQQQLQQWRTLSVTKQFLRILQAEREGKIAKLTQSSLNPAVNSETIRMYATELANVEETLKIYQDDDLFTKKYLTLARP